MLSSNIFSGPIATDAPPASIGSRKDHPVPRLGIAAAAPIQTNKFYANFFLGNQTAPTYLHPYSVFWAGAKDTSGSWGMAISHIDANQRVYGSETNPVTGTPRYYINPVGISSICISAKELGSTTAVTSDALTAFSARIILRASLQGASVIEFPLVQGSAFVTAVFNGACPLIQTGIFYKTVTRSTKEARPGITKYKLYLEDGTTWLLYAHHTKGDPLDLQIINNGLAQAKGPFYGVIQVAKDPGNADSMYDRTCGVYATDVELSGSAHGEKGTYTFNFKKAGMNLTTTLAMFALPHHQTSFDDQTRDKMTDVKLQTTTKGIAIAVVADSWTMVEPSLPVSIGFVPWLPEAGSISNISSTNKTFIHNIAQQEMKQDILAQTDQPSMYFAGKALAKFAVLIMAIHDILGDNNLAQAGLERLKQAFARFAENKQQYPLVYESAWGGVVSTASYANGNASSDFGNTYYNDHHFHYGYFIYCAAVIGHLDPSWIAANKAYVNMFVRDIANPSPQDKFFPVSRSFDWYHGHSWAHGLIETGDGKDQESSSEDSMHAYAIKMWGNVSGDKKMEARGNLMLAIQARSFPMYYLYTKTNNVQPPNFIGNKVAGILFENKIDHLTYFGPQPEEIEGIHMLPLLPHTPYIRARDFVEEEWNTYFANGRAENIVGGWRGIVYANRATFDPKGAYAFFSTPGFDPSWLDGGASLTWYLCYSAGM
ncbi:hypothetical protein QBC46DRAFT_258081 [Diplogelasinospora grovesii]|uniref:glucan endo-1,3-beta-D-glucosidase n=1 Tax=Diplogelasinospora grovesii TaxID=303347 RepID=A0AAN6ND70_9PEZI|nr:hypothetical protein QBC46DRAFT_258081 [Diplogelasinospora grovesii]